MRRVATFTIACLLAFTSRGQSNDDFGVWVSPAIQKKLTQKFAIHLNGSLRTRENSTQIQQILGETGLSYKFSKRFKVELMYRKTFRWHPEGYFYNPDRFYTDITYKQPAGKFSISNRIRLQSTFRHNLLQTELQNAKYYFRDAVTFKYDTEKRTKPWIAGEIFVPLRDLNDFTIDNIRARAGFDYEFNEQHAIGLYYMYQREVNVRKPQTDYIAGVNYEFKF